MSTPLLLSTWTFGLPANRAGLPYISLPDGALDAVERAAIAAELDLSCDSVGIGGLPDASGEVTLDAAVMLSPAQSAGVAAVRNYAHVASLARKVMELTDHKLLVGAGAELFAQQLGFPSINLLTDATKKQYEEWASKSDVERRQLREDAYKANREIDLTKPASATPSAPSSILHPLSSPPPSPPPGHDTIGILALDASNTLAGACTTSGRPYKLPGRVGDSPILGQGLYVDPTAGAATATGNGELIMGACASFLIVEQMRNGATPLDAIKHALERIASSYELKGHEQAAFLALAPDGRWASASLRPGFQHALTTPDSEELLDPQFVLIPRKT